MVVQEAVCGIDEAGRGPLAGPVCAAAVILNPEAPISGLNDSKVLSAKQRERLELLIRQHSLAWCVGWASVEEIDQLNIRQANFLAMARAFDGLSTRPVRALVDGSEAPPLPCETICIIGGDRSVPAISAASILAKVERDREMARLDLLYPGYGFARHKGYGTRAHLEELRLLGPSPVHRRSFAPVRALLGT